MKLLVTGGLGFIGSNFVRKVLNETDHQVVTIDKMTYAANRDNLDLDKSRHEFYQQDIVNQEEITRILKEEKPDAIVHMAAESHVDRSISGPQEFLRTNVGGTFSLLQASRDYLVEFEKPDFKFVHVSTDEVYGSLNLDSADKFHEEYPYRANSPYSASKAASDLFVRSWIHTYAFPGIITHCSNNYGPYQHVEKLIPKAIVNFHRCQDVPVYAQGQNVRDWIYVDDHCAGLLQVLKRGQVGEVYDFGGNAEMANLDVVQRVGEIMMRYQKDLLFPETHIKFVKDRPGHDLRYAIDSSKALEMLDWKPKHTFENGLGKTIYWYMKNKKWWDV